MVKLSLFVSVGVVGLVLWHPGGLQFVCIVSHLRRDGSGDVGGIRADIFGFWLRCWSSFAALATFGATMVAFRALDGGMRWIGCLSMSPLHVATPHLASLSRQSVSGGGAGGCLWGWYNGISRFLTVGVSLAQYLLTT